MQLWLQALRGLSSCVSVQRVINIFIPLFCMGCELHCVLVYHIFDWVEFGRFPIVEWTRIYLETTSLLINDYRHTIESQNRDLGDREEIVYYIYIANQPYPGERPKK